MASALPFKPEEEGSLLESVLRSAAGVGVGMGVYWAYKTQYNAMRRKFLGLPLSQEIKRRLTRMASFAGTDFEVTEFQKRLGIKSYLEVIPQTTAKDVLVDAIEKKRTHILAAFRRVADEVARVRGTAGEMGVSPQVLDNYVAAFTDFQSGYFERAMGTAEALMGEAFKGRGRQTEADILRGSRADQVEVFNQRLGVVQQRLEVMEQRVRDTQRRVLDLQKSLPRRLQKQMGATGQTAESVRDRARVEIAKDIERNLEAGTTDLATLADIASDTSLPLPNRPNVTRFWTAKAGEADLRRDMTLRKLIGQEAHQTLGEAVMRNYKESILAPDIAGERAKTLDVMKLIKRTIQELERSTIEVDGKTIKQFSKIEVGVSQGSVNSVIIKAKPIDPKRFGREEYVIPIHLHDRIEFGTRYVSRGNKDFFVPYNKQRDVVSAQLKAVLAKMPWADAYKMGTAQETTDRVNAMILNEMTTISHGPLADFMMSTRIDQRITHQNSKIYESGFENFNKVMRSKMGKGGILTIDTEFSNNKTLPHEIGWVLRDAEGNIISGRHFIIGRSAKTAPEHLLGKKIGGADIVQHVDENQLDQVIEALARDMDHPRLHGHPISIAGKNWGQAEGMTIQALLERAEALKIGDSGKIAMIKAGILKSTVIDTNSIPTVMGETMDLQGVHLFRLMKEYLANPKLADLKEAYEARLRLIGIPGFTEAGEMIFQEGTHKAFQDAYMQSLFPDAIYDILSRTKGFTEGFEQELQGVKEGFLPKRLGLAGIIDPDQFHALQYDLMRTVSPSSWLKGSLDPTFSNLMGWFPDLKPGSGHRTVFSMPINLQAEKRLKAELRHKFERMGKYTNPAAILKKVFNDIQTKTLVFLDAGQTGLLSRERFLMASKMKTEFSLPYAEVVDRVDPNIRVGTEVGFGSGRFYILGRRGSQNVEFRALDHASTGVVKEIIPPSHPGGQSTIMIERKGRIGANTPVLGPQAGLISATPLEEMFPHIGPEFGFATAATYTEKVNPGVALENMFSLLFEHAGSDPGQRQIRNKILIQIFKQKLRQKSADLKEPRFFPLTTRPDGVLAFQDGNLDFWRELNKRVDQGTFVEIAEEYNRQVNGAFTAPRLIIDNTKAQRPEMLQVSDAFFKTFGNMVGNRRILTANLRVAIDNIRRETADDPIANMTLSDIKAVVRNAEGMFKKGMVYEGFRSMRPDILRRLRAEGNDTQMGFFSKLPAYFGFAKNELTGTYDPVTVSQHPVNAKDIAVMGGVGEVGLGRARIAIPFLRAAQNLQGSEDLITGLLKDMYSESSLRLARLYNLPIATGRVTPPGMAIESLADFNKSLEKWVKLPSTTSLGEGWIPVDAIYEVAGKHMTIASASEYFGISPLRFQDMVKEGKATLVTDFGVLRRRMRAPEDVEEMLNRQPFLLETGQHVGVRVRGTKKDSQVHRLLVSAAINEDYYLMPYKNTRTGETKLFYNESMAMFKLREVIHTLNAGAFVDPNGKDGLKVLHEYMETLGEGVLKRDLYTRQMTVNIPVIRLQNAHAVHELVSPDALTTKEGTVNVLKRLLKVKEVNRGSFLQARGVSPTEGLLVGDDEVFERMVRGMSWDDMRAAAKRMLGNVKFGDQTGFSPRSAMLRHLAKEGDKTMADALGVLENMVNRKAEDLEARKKFAKYAAEGIYGLPMMASKYPLADQTKFSAGLFFRAQATSDERTRINYGTGTGRIGVVTHGSLRVGNTDADGDIMQFLMGRGKDILKIMEKNSFLPELEPLSTFVDTHDGQVTIFNNATGTFHRHDVPTALKNLGFNRIGTQESELITKQFAGQVTVFSDNIGSYMRRMLSTRGGALANDLGQEGIERINRNVFEAAGAMTEAILKGKATNASTETVSDLLKNFGNATTFERFAKDVHARSATEPQFQRLVAKIGGTEHLYPGTHGVSALEIMQEAMRQGKSGDLFDAMTPNERILGTALQARDIYGMKGTLVQAMNEMFFTQGIPTRFNEMTRESTLKSLKRNIQQDLGEKTWKNVSTGMAWLAGASALYIAANIFNPDDNEFLGPRPGRGGETFDWAFTRPEYKMANLLDLPYNNPYDTKRAYVAMDNPLTNEKLSKLADRERRDLFMIHQAITGEKIRDTITARGRRDTDHRSLLERFGHT